MPPVYFRKAELFGPGIYLGATSTFRFFGRIVTEEGESSCLTNADGTRRYELVKTRRATTDPAVFASKAGPATAERHEVVADYAEFCKDNSPTKAAVTLQHIPDAEAENQFQEPDDEEAAQTEGEEIPEGEQNFAEWFRKELERRARQERDEAEHRRRAREELAQVRQAEAEQRQAEQTAAEAAEIWQRAAEAARHQEILDAQAARHREMLDASRLQREADQTAREAQTKAHEDALAAQKTQHEEELKQRKEQHEEELKQRKEEAKATIDAVIGKNTAKRKIDPPKIKAEEPLELERELEKWATYDAERGTRTHKDRWLDLKSCVASQSAFDVLEMVEIESGAMELESSFKLAISTLLAELKKYSRCDGGTLRRLTKEKLDDLAFDKTLKVSKACEQFFVKYAALRVRCRNKKALLEETKKPVNVSTEASDEREKIVERLPDAVMDYVFERMDIEAGTVQQVLDLIRAYGAMAHAKERKNARKGGKQEEEKKDEKKNSSQPSETAFAVQDGKTLFCAICDKEGNHTTLNCFDNQKGPRFRPKKSSEAAATGDRRNQQQQSQQKQGNQQQQQQQKTQKHVRECHFFKKGKCRNGDDCPFRHVLNSVDECPEASGEEPTESAFMVEMQAEGADEASEPVSMVNPVKMQIDNGSGPWIVNDPTLIEIDAWESRDLGVARKGVTLSSKARGTLRCRKWGFEMKNTLYCPDAAKNLAGSFAMKKQTGIVDRATEGYLLKPNGTRIPVNEDKNRGFFYLDIVKYDVKPPEEVCNFIDNEAPPAGDAKVAVEMQTEAVSESQLQHARNLHRGTLEGCETCKAAKLVDRRHKKSGVTYPEAKEFGDLVQLDAIGPFVSSKHGQRRYGFIARDIVTRWAVGLCTSDRKGAGIKLLEKWRLENRKMRAVDTGKPDAADEEMTAEEIEIFEHMKSAWPDHAGEFDSGEFKAYLLDNNIAKHPNRPGDHKESGLAERGNRSSETDSRCTLYEGKQPVDQWNLAFMWSIYVSNRIVNRSLGCSPYEKRYGRAPSLKNIKVWGSQAFLLPAIEKRGSKIFPQTRAGIFMGIDETKKAFIVEIDGKLVTGPQCSFLEEIRRPGGYTAAEASVVKSLKFYPKESAQISAAAVQAVENSEGAEVGAVQSGAPDKLLFEEDAKTSREFEKISLTNPDVYHGAIPEVWDVFAVEGDDPEPHDEETQAALEKEIAVHLERNAFSEATPEQLAAWKPNTPIPAKVLFKRKRDGRLKSRFYVQGCKEPRVETDLDKLGSMIDFTHLRAGLARLANSKTHVLRTFDAVSAYIESDYVTPKPDAPKPVIKLPKLMADRVGYTYAVANRALNGLVYAGWSWECHRNSKFEMHGWVKNSIDPSVFTLKTPGEDEISVCTFVDDFPVIGPEEAVEREMAKLGQDMPLKFIAPVKIGDWEKQDILGLEVCHNLKDRRVVLSQNTYLQGVVAKTDLKIPTKTPAEVGAQVISHSPETPEFLHQKQVAGGQINFPCHMSRPDLAPAQRNAMSSPGTEETCKLFKRIFRYCLNPKCLVFEPNEGNEPMGLTGYSDSDYANLKCRHSISGVIVFYGRSPICWVSKKQPIIAQSSTEAEIVAENLGFKVIRKCENFIRSMWPELEVPILRVDNDPAVKYTISEAITTRVKHIDVRYLAVREAHRRGLFKIEWTPGAENPADGFTKLLPPAGFARWLTRICVRDLPLELVD